MLIRVIMGKISNRTRFKIYNLFTSCELPEGPHRCMFPIRPNLQNCSRYGSCDVTWHSWLYRYIIYQTDLLFFHPYLSIYNKLDEGQLPTWCWIACLSFIRFWVVNLFFSIRARNGEERISKIIIVSSP